jgi:hypothetical protein
MLIKEYFLKTSQRERGVKQSHWEGKTMSLKLKNHCKDKSFNRHLQISHSDNIKKTWERCSRTTPTNIKSHFLTHIKYQKY